MPTETMTTHTQLWASASVMTPGVLIVVLLMATPVTRVEGQKPEVAGSEPTFRTQVNLLSLAVRVTDRKDNEIHGLTANRFSLYEDGVPQKIAFFNAEDEPVSLGILLDVSGSMAATGKLDRAKTALSLLLSTIRPDDEMFYLQFHRQVDRIVDFTGDSHRILSAISETGVTQDGTSLYDAVAKALCYIRNAHHHKRAILVVTDNADQYSHRSLEELIPIVQASQAQVFIIGCFSKGEYDFYRSLHGEKATLVTNREIDNPLVAFKQLADESGAECFFPSVDKLQEAVDAVAHQLRTQYTLAYYPKAGAGGFRHIEVKVAEPGARVRARRGFEGVETATASGSSQQLADCEHEKLRPYPYESKIAIKNGCTIYHEDFQSKESGWPSKHSYHYGDGTYQIANASATGQSDYSVLPSSPYVWGPVGIPRSGADPAEGVLVANGPWFADMNAAVSVEIKSAGGAGDTAAAPGLVFHLNDRGYYAVLISSATPGSHEVALKLVKKYHYEQAARDLLPWTPVPLSDVIAARQQRIE
ncbi:MAG TPA: VWA domain-containing protein, partial [Terriglobales bacterium]